MKKKKKLKGTVQFYMALPLISIIVFSIVDIIVWFFDVKYGIILTIIFLIYSLVSVFLYGYCEKKIIKEMVSFSREYSNSEIDFVKGMSIPFGLIHKNQILWVNDELKKLFGDKVEQGSIISEKFPKLSNAINNMNSKHISSCHIRFEDKVYKIVLKESGIRHRVNGNIKNFIMDVSAYYGIYFYDETELIRYKKEAADKSIVTGLIYVDNYDDVIESIDEVDQSYVTALIDRKIAGYIKQYDGICKKMENDKYFVIFKNVALSKMEEDKFSIIKSIKNISSEIEISPTISIGIGAGGDTYDDCYRFARLSIELAESRGGDQVVVQDNSNEVRYYGGKSEREQKNNRVKARVNAEAIRDLLVSQDSIFIMGHKLSDVDSIGAAVGISCIAKAFLKKVKIVLDDEISSVKPIIKRLKSDDMYDDDIFVKSSEAISSANENSLIIVVDTNRPSMVECEELLNISKIIAVIDHHRKSNDSFKNTVFSYIEPYASSTCEMVTELIRYVSDEIKLSYAEADSMYAGIMIDTNNFLNKTGVRTFEAAAYLKRSGCDVVRVRKIFRDDLESYQAKALAIQYAEIYRNNFAIAVFPDVDVDSPTIIGAQVANELLNIDSVKASFVLTEYKNKVYLSARSIDEVNVQIISEKLGGGGHMSIAGAQIKGEKPENVKNKLKNILDEMIEKGDL